MLGSDCLRHLALLHFIAREDQYPPRLVKLQQGPHEGLTERAGSSGDQNRLSVEICRRCFEIVKHLVRSVFPSYRTWGEWLTPSARSEMSPSRLGESGYGVPFRSHFN